MANVTHRKVTSGTVNPAVEVDLSDWNDTHVGLENVDNTSDANKPVSTAQAAADAIVAASAANASNLTSGTIPAARLPAVATPQVSVFTSGTAQTYTTPANAKYLIVELVGPGGGGAGSGTTPGSGGNGSAATTFSTLSAGAGAGGTSASGGAAGAVSGGDLNIRSANGGNPTGASNQSGGQGTPAALYSVFAPLSGSANIGFAGGGFGAGGSGAGDGATPNTGGGGAGGGYVKKLITSPSTTYTYTVGSGGAGGTAGTSGFVGGAGAGGLIIVTAYFQ